MCSFGDGALSTVQKNIRRARLADAGLQGRGARGLGHVPHQSLNRPCARSGLEAQSLILT